MTSADIDLAKAATSPASATIGDRSVSAHSLGDMIEAKKALQAEETVAKATTGQRSILGRIFRGRFVLPSALGD